MPNTFYALRIPARAAAAHRCTHKSSPSSRAALIATRDILFAAPSPGSEAAESLRRARTRAVSSGSSINRRECDLGSWQVVRHVLCRRQPLTRGFVLGSAGFNSSACSASPRDAPGPSHCATGTMAGSDSALRCTSSNHNGKSGARHPRCLSGLTPGVEQGHRADSVR